MDEVVNLAEVRAMDSELGLLCFALGGTTEMNLDKTYACPDAWKNSHCTSVARSFSLATSAPNEIRRSVSYLSARYMMIALDSQSAKSPLWWSTSVGMRPLGFRRTCGAFLCSNAEKSR